MSNQKYLSYCGCADFDQRTLNNTSILLVKRKNDQFQDCWAFPGGFVEEGESLDQAASRELLEETNLSIKLLRQLQAFGDPDRDSQLENGIEALKLS